MIDVTRCPSSLAQAQPRQPRACWCQLLPFALMMGIFYLLVLMPMRKRQKKVQEFQAALKVGDRVITTGGIYGQVTKVDDETVQLQIADKVRIDVARAAIGGYQGQEPVVPPDGGRDVAHVQEPSLEAPRHRRPSPALAVWSFTPPSQKIKLGLDLKGGVHLVLEVQTDDALKARDRDDGRTAARSAEGRRASRVSDARVDEPDRRSPSRASRRRATSSSGRSRPTQLALSLRP